MTSNSVEQTNDGGFIIGGERRYKANPYYISGYILKTNRLGHPRWNYIVQGGCAILNMQQTITGDYIGFGNCATGCDSTDFSFYIIKLDSQGDEKWLKFHFIPIAFACTYLTINSMDLTDDGGFILLGKAEYELSGPADNASDLCLLKFDSDGNLVWEKILDLSLDDNGAFIEQTDDAGFVILGNTTHYTHNLILCKTDNLGNLEWFNTAVNSRSYVGISLSSTADGGFVLIGNNFPGNSSFLIKTNGMGEIEWERNYDNLEYLIPSGRAVQQTFDSGFIILGNTFQIESGHTVQLMKLDVNAELEWITPIPSTDQYCYDMGNWVQQTNDGGYIISGDSDDALLLIKTDQNGKVITESLE